MTPHTNTPPSDQKDQNAAPKRPFGGLASKAGDIWAQRAAKMKDLPKPGRPRISLNPLLLVVLGLVTAQVFLAEKDKPGRIAGEAASDFYGEIMNESNRKEIELAQQHEIATRLAALQADYAEWQGLCAIAAMIDPEAGRLCTQGAENYYREALTQIRRSEVHIPEAAR